MQIRDAIDEEPERPYDEEPEHLDNEHLEDDHVKEMSLEDIQNALCCLVRTRDARQCTVINNKEAIIGVFQSARKEKRVHVEAQRYLYKMI